MLTFPHALKIYLAVEPVDMRQQFNGLWAQAEQKLREDPRQGALFAFTNKDRNRIKLLYWDGSGVWIFAKRLEKGRFIWPQADSGSVALSPAQLSMLLEGIDWRMPERTWRPERAA